MGDDKRDRHDEQALVSGARGVSKTVRAGGAITMSDATNAATTHHPSTYVATGAPDA